METTHISCDSPVCHTEKVLSTTPKGVLKPGDQTPLAALAGEFGQTIASLKKYNKNTIYTDKPVHNGPL